MTATAEDAPSAAAPHRFMLRTGEGLGDNERIPPPGLLPNDRFTTASEYLGFAAHGYRMTHLDSFSHAFWDRQMYNGISAELVNSHQGASQHGIESFIGGIVTRGVLVDAPRYRGVDWMEPGEGVTADELHAILGAQSIEVRPGDALLLRTGYGLKRLTVGVDRPEVGSPGWHASCLREMHEWQISICGADVAQDVRPSVFETLRSPIHAVGLVAMGMPLIDNADLEQLAVYCAKVQRWEFFFTLAPTAAIGATSSLVNPLAIF
jgi:hypothetical protein